MASAPVPSRNIGILAHIDAGKTSLTERLLFITGRIRSAGDIESGTTTTDFLAVERERGITVQAAAARLEWKGVRIALIDTPGHVDFGAEVGRSLRALDGAVVLVCGVAGLQSRTETLLRALSRRGMPRIAFINKMDRRGASFERVLGELRAFEDGRFLAIQLPWGEGEAFRGVVDLIEMCAWDFPAGDSNPGTARLDRLPLPAELLEAARAGRASLVEALAGGLGGAEGDAVLMEDFAQGREPSPAELKRALRAAVLAGQAIPVLCGSAFVNGAAALLLDAVIDCLPSPREAACPEGLGGERRKASPDESFSAQVFKTQSDPHFGRLSWARIWSGRLSAGDRVLEAGSGLNLRVTKLFSIQASSVEEVAGAEAGDIVALAFGSAGPAAARRASLAAAEDSGRAPASTGASLCAPERPILYEQISFEEPVVTIALEPRNRTDEAALKAAIAGLLEEDPSLRLREDAETGRLALSGMGELHLEVALERLRTEKGVAVRAGKIEVAYRECLSGTISAHRDFERNVNGEESGASIDLSLESGERGSGLEFSAAAGIKVAPAILAALRRGIEAALSAGPSFGYPVVDVVARLDALSLSDPKAELSAEIAASLAARDCLGKAGTGVLEPWMRVEISLPEECLGEAVAVLSSRSGRIEAITEAAGGKFVEAAAPLRLLFGLAGELRSATKGRAELQLRFLRYEHCPRAAFQRSRRT